MDNCSANCSAVTIAFYIYSAISFALIVFVVCVTLVIRKHDKARVGSVGDGMDSGTFVLRENRFLATAILFYCIVVWVFLVCELC